MLYFFVGGWGGYKNVSWFSFDGSCPNLGTFAKLVPNLGLLIPFGIPPRNKISDYDNEHSNHIGINYLILILYVNNALS